MNGNCCIALLVYCGLLWITGRTSWLSPRSEQPAHQHSAQQASSRYCRIGPTTLHVLHKVRINYVGKNTSLSVWGSFPSAGSGAEPLPPTHFTYF